MADSAISPMIDLAKGLGDVSGDFIELGCFCGNSSVKLVRVSHAQGKVLHCVDSFQGLGAPGVHDIASDGSVEFPYRRFDTGGPDKFIERMEGDGFARGDDFMVWQGWIPNVFERFPPGADNKAWLSLAFLDLDHYGPTYDAIMWAWPRLAPGGLMICHDYVVQDEQICAWRAINQFIDGAQPRVARIVPGSIAFRK